MRKVGEINIQSRIVDRICRSNIYVDRRRGPFAAQPACDGEIESNKSISCGLSINYRLICDHKSAPFRTRRWETFGIRSSMQTFVGFRPDRRKSRARLGVWKISRTHPRTARSLLVSLSPMPIRYGSRCSPCHSRSDRLLIEV